MFKHRQFEKTGLKALFGVPLILNQSNYTVLIKQLHTYKMLTFVYFRRQALRLTPR